MHKATHFCDLYTFPNGCHVAEVEIDPETGEVTLDRYVIFDDYGRLLDPRLTLGQVHGGVVQGIGQALFEQALFDAETGQVLTGSLMDYALPRADDLPSFEGSLTAEFPSRANRLGVKGSGQAGAIGRTRHRHERGDERAGAIWRAASRHARNTRPDLGGDTRGGELGHAHSEVSDGQASSAAISRARSISGIRRFRGRMIEVRLAGSTNDGVAQST